MLSILGLVAIIVATYFVYKTARDQGRNAALWAVITFFTGFGIQIVIPLLIGIVLGIIWAMQGTTDPAALQARIQGPATIIGVVCLVLSFVVIWLILRAVSKVPEGPAATQPPPPPNF